MEECNCPECQDKDQILREWFEDHDGRAIPPEHCVHLFIGVYASHLAWARTTIPLGPQVVIHFDSWVQQWEYAKIPSECGGSSFEPQQKDGRKLNVLRRYETLGDNPWYQEFCEDPRVKEAASKLQVY